MQNRALIQYLESRKISFKPAAKYLEEIYYQREGKSYFALTFPNDSGGYELKNKIQLHGVRGKKDVSTIKGTNPDSGVLVVFEAFMDFLSGLEYWGVSQPKNTTIVLNTASLPGRIKDKLENCREIQCFLDRDKPRKEALENSRKKKGDRQVCSLQ